MCRYVDAIARIATTKASLASCRPIAACINQRITPIPLSESLHAQRLLRPTVFHPSFDTASSCAQSLPASLGEVTQQANAQAVQMADMEAAGWESMETRGMRGQSLSRGAAQPPCCAFLADDVRSRAAGLRACVSMLQLLLQSDQRIVNHV